MRELDGDPAQAFPGNGRMKPEQPEITRLRKEVARLEAERDILEKCHGVLRAGCDMTFVFIAKHRHVWPLEWMCSVLEVSLSGSTLG